MFYYFEGDFGFAQMLAAVDSEERDYGVQMPVSKKQENEEFLQKLLETNYQEDE